MTPKLNKRKCKICKLQFQKERPLQFTCSINCSIEYTKQRNEHLKRLDAKKQRKVYKDTKDKLKTRQDHLREAQRHFNTWIRCRDEGLPCIACNKPMNKKINASHYKTVGAHPELRFEPLNCHSGCEACNTYLSGNIVNYRINLIKRIGIDKVEWLEGSHEEKHYSVEEIKEIGKKYKQLVRELQNARG